MTIKVQYKTEEIAKDISEMILKAISHRLAHDFIIYEINKILTATTIVMDVVFNDLMKKERRSLYCAMCHFWRLKCIHISFESRTKRLR